MGEVVEVCVEQAIHPQITTPTKGKMQGTIQIITTTVMAKPTTTREATIEGNSEASHNRTEHNPLDAWLPITESRDGNAFTSAFHVLCSGIGGVQALLLPLAFAALGWFWGILCLSVAFGWQLYTIWVLVHLHESSVSGGTRYSRYLHLSIAAFGTPPRQDPLDLPLQAKAGGHVQSLGRVQPSVLLARVKFEALPATNTYVSPVFYLEQTLGGEKLGKLLAIFPVMYLSGGTCVMLIINGGGAMKLLYQTMCGDGLTCNTKTMSGAEWFLVFICLAILIAQFFPNLNSIAGVSLIGGIAAMVYCTMVWALSISFDRPAGTSHDPSKAASSSEMGGIRGVLTGLGIIALAFRGHNLVLEIQGTMPSSSKHPSHKPMWRGVTMSYPLISMCLFPLAIGGYWAYGNMLVAEGGLLNAFSKFHRHNTTKFVMGFIYLLVLINCLCSFQIYAMPVFDNLEFRYIVKRKKQCPRLLRLGIRVFFGGLTYFIAMTFPFLPSLAALIGGITLPLTYAYPCFMWIAIKKPSPNSAMWWSNLCLGCLGIVLSVLLVIAAVWNIVINGLDANFFRPHLKDAH